MLDEKQMPTYRYDGQRSCFLHLTNYVVNCGTVQLDSTIKWIQMHQSEKGAMTKRFLFHPSANSNPAPGISRVSFNVFQCTRTRESGGEKRRAKEGRSDCAFGVV